MNTVRMTRIEREYWISCAHMLPGYTGNCARLHGHNYKVVVSLLGLIDDSTGMLLDFAQLDKIVKPILDQMDHRMLVAGDEWPYINCWDRGDDFYPVGLRTTAENISWHICQRVEAAMITAGLMSEWGTEDDLIKEVGVVVWETPRSSAYSA